ncbi:hypothetical protein ALC57_02193 [Trachymyrmex cornetzi]|uniref:Uncharacterized protein n=1 Tax=Trachymyrmex cornetzi TaxID=471704 RepID=A0A195EK00_9HYME|nr:hypothetical protein ALC57_02193 [Trachymyrmex cornetzi]
MAPLTGSSLLSRGSMHLLLHKYCNSGKRYLPQKSTNLMCSTRLLKKTPAQKSKS